MRVNFTNRLLIIQKAHIDSPAKEAGCFIDGICFSLHLQPELSIWLIKYKSVVLMPFIFQALVKQVGIG